MTTNSAEPNLNLPLVPESHPALHSVAQVTFDFDYVRRIKDDLLATMYWEKGVGLAAPQVGIELRILVMNCGEREIVLVNPRVSGFSGRRKTAREGCLSLPGMLVDVTRFENVDVVAEDENGEKQTYKFQGKEARCFQHELDHLNGILIKTYL